MWFNTKTSPKRIKKSKSLISICYPKVGTGIYSIFWWYHIWKSTSRGFIICEAYEGRESLRPSLTCRPDEVDPNFKNFFNQKSVSQKRKSDFYTLGQSWYHYLKPCQTLLLFWTKRLENCLKIHFTTKPLNCAKQRWGLVLDKAALR